MLGTPSPTTNLGTPVQVHLSDGGLVDGGVGISCAAGTGKQCVATCGGTPTTLSGTVYDPAGQSPIYNAAVFVPGGPLPTLSPGPSCDCSSLFPSSIISSAVTDATGAFVLTNVPSGAEIPIVVQVGKWRIVYAVDIQTDCSSNSVPDHTLLLPRSSAEGNLPDIAISTGGADSLECLPLRLGLDPSEYVAGSGKSGHVHVFQGNLGAKMNASTPSSPAALWDSVGDLMNNDVVLLSCEGRETTGVTAASQQALLQYASNGGRVFASHYHYVWFDTGPFGNYPLARWTTGPQLVVPGDDASVPGDIVTSVGNGGAFPEGLALQQWLGVTGALTNGQLPIWYARHNADVPLTGSGPSQAWITLDPSVGATHAGATQYLSFDAPLDHGPQCGRVVYSDLHVSGGPGSAEPGVPPDYPNPTIVGTDRQGGIVPDQCAQHPLTPQEKALEFMLFDLSSCLIPIGGSATPPR